MEVSAETPPQGTGPEELHHVTTDLEISSPNRELLLAVEEAENANPTDGLCYAMLQLDLGESELQNLTGVPQREVDAYRNEASARKRKRNKDRAARQRGAEVQGNQGQTNADVVTRHQGIWGPK
ncbi:hypothetical protein CYMTET_11254 [Cymbomonas tetramitiformis]|uniref:Uncharacterized protein n=1 Tax=Cymbomonas tetramitiformis TaxID=36881 RepID=A0AAE0GN31_9CHLO|nr:hypothetical protein CYMTET_11254 [Cymbomonas tetramitiformis]